MSDKIQIKRRIDGAQAAPSGANIEGELAVYYPGTAGTTGKPTVYGNDGAGWRVIVDGNDLGGIPNFAAGSSYGTGDVVIQGGNIYQATGAVTPGAFSPASWTKITNTGGVSVVGLNAGTDQGSLFATFNADLITVPSGQVTVYSYNGTAYIYTGPVGSPVATATSPQFTALGAAPTFASGTDVTTGTDLAKVLNSKLLRDELARALGPVTTANLLAGNAATATAAAVSATDANKLVALGTGGKIDPGFINMTGLNFLGAVDVTAAPTTPVGGFKAGDIYFNNKAGAANPAWVGIPGVITSVGDMLVFDGAKWAALAAEADLAKYVPLVGATMTSGDTTKLTFGPTKKDGTITVLDAGEGALVNCWIDGGNF